MNRTPARGLVLIKKPTLTDKVGSLYVLDKTKEGWTLGQAEVVAVGPPAFAEWDDEDQIDGVVPVDARVKPGAWVLCRFRSWVSTDKDDEFLCKISDVLAVITGSA